jgi:hypothetical protein
LADERFADPVGGGKSLKPAPSMIGGAVMTSLMLPLSGDLFDLPAEAIVDNLLILRCSAWVRFWHIFAVSKQVP